MPTDPKTKFKTGDITVEKKPIQTQFARVTDPSTVAAQTLREGDMGLGGLADALSDFAGNLSANKLARERLELDKARFDYQKQQEALDKAEREERDQRFATVSDQFTTGIMDVIDKYDGKRAPIEVRKEITSMYKNLIQTPEWKEMHYKDKNAMTSFFFQQTGALMERDANITQHGVGIWNPNTETIEYRFANPSDQEQYVRSMSAWKFAASNPSLVAYAQSKGMSLEEMMSTHGELVMNRTLLDQALSQEALRIKSANVGEAGKQANENAAILLGQQVIDNYLAHQAKAMFRGESLTNPDAVFTDFQTSAWNAIKADQQFLNLLQAGNIDLADVEDQLMKHIDRKKPQFTALGAERQIEDLSLSRNLEVQLAYQARFSIEDEVTAKIIDSTVKSNTLMSLIYARGQEGSEFFKEQVSRIVSAAAMKDGAHQIAVRGLRDKVVKEERADFKRDLILKDTEVAKAMATFYLMGDLQTQQQYIEQDKALGANYAVDVVNIMQDAGVSLDDYLNSANLNPDQAKRIKTNYNRYISQLRGF